MKKLFPWFFLGLFPFSFISCTCEKTDPEVAVNPAFERDPPLAKEVTIQLVKDNSKGNLLLVAHFEPGKIREPFHALALSPGKAVLRDDGKEGDVKAGDGQFSILLNEDIEALQKELAETEKNLDQIRRVETKDFRGREVFPRDFKSFKDFKIDIFKKGGIFHLPPDLLCRITHPVSIPHSLFVTNLGTVEDPSRTVLTPCTTPLALGGAWSFEKLITDMANPTSTGVSPENFVKDWLDIWMHDASANGETVAARTNIFTIITTWLVRSGTPVTDITTANWKTKPLDLTKAPFKLSAIVNRLDLRGNMGYGVTNPGEGRFIFEVVDNVCEPFEPGFTVIFEYGLPLSSCAAVSNFGQRWYNLKNLPLGSPAYNDSLQAITDVFTKANAAPSRPNGSSINQIRTNERNIGAPWELREFNLSPSTHKLFLTTVKQEPAEKYNEVAQTSTPPNPIDVAKLRDWINDPVNLAKILVDKHKVPDSLPTGEPFLGAKAHSEPGFWKATGVLNSEARHHFSLNTCSGCHKEETGVPFVQLRLLPFGVECSPNGFLTGTTTNDPVSGTPHSFNDLLNRQQRLQDLICTPCGSKLRQIVTALTFDPISMVH